MMTNYKNGIDEQEKLLAKLRAEVFKVSSKKQQLEALRNKEYSDEILRASEDGKNPLTLSQMVALSNGNFSRQSITNYGRMAEVHRKGFTYPVMELGKDGSVEVRNIPVCSRPTFPKLNRKAVTKVHHYAELNEEGQPIEGTQFDVEKTEYVYWMEE